MFESTHRKSKAHPKRRLTYIVGSFVFLTEEGKTCNIDDCSNQVRCGVEDEEFEGFPLRRSVKRTHWDEEVHRKVD